MSWPHLSPGSLLIHFSLMKPSTSRGTCRLMAETATLAVTVNAVNGTQALAVQVGAGFAAWHALAVGCKHSTTSTYPSSTPAPPLPWPRVAEQAEGQWQDEQFHG